MANSATEIVNSALAKLGAGRIISLDDNNEQAKITKQQYEALKLDLLGSHPWNFAIKQTTLNKSATAPVMDYTAKYPLPRDYIRLLNVDLPKNTSWKVEGKFLFTYMSDSTVNIRYISKEIMEGDFTPMFAEVLALKIAADVCYSLTQSTTLAEAMLAKYERALRTARSFDGQESQGDRVYADNWLNARY